MKKQQRLTKQERKQAYKTRKNRSIARKLKRAA